MRSTKANPLYLGVGGRGIYKSALIELNVWLSEVPSMARNLDERLQGANRLTGVMRPERSVAE